jgi:hypothetical protein
MAWFDYAAALGQGLGQGAQDFRAMRQQRAAQARQERLDKIAEEDRLRAQALEELQTFDPDNIPDDWVRRNPGLSKTFVTKTGTGYQMRMDPLIRERRALEKTELDVKGVELPGRREEVQRRTSAARAVRDPAFALAPYEDKIRLLEEAGVSNVRPYLAPEEFTRYYQESVEWKKLQEQLKAEREIAGLRLAGAASRDTGADDVRDLIARARTRAAEELKDDETYLNAPTPEKEAMLSARTRDIMQLLGIAGAAGSGSAAPQRQVGRFSFRME